MPPPLTPPGSPADTEFQRNRGKGPTAPLGFVLESLEACAAEELTTRIDDGVFVVIDAEREGYFPTVTIYGTSREAIVRYVSEHWGGWDGVDEWLEEVAAHVVEVRS